ncbi:MAG TPA: ferrous iron transporter B [Syntrophomonadaceae bacterium]|nr:ferrous iron transporter B [Syntrophomonadaceae bacterium]
MSEAPRGCRIDLTEAHAEQIQHNTKLTEKMDRILLHRFWGFPIMILCFTLLFGLSFTLGKPVSSWIGLLLDHLAAAMENSAFGLVMPRLIMSLISDGVLRGIGSALAFFPQMLLFFTFYTLISDTGYSERIAYLMRQPMSRINMDRRAFAPLILGFSCNIPAIVSTHDIPNRVDRLIVMLVTTFTPCSARIGVILYIAGAFFSPAIATIVMSGLIILSWAVSALISYLIKSHYPAALETDSAVYRLPPYHWPEALTFVKSVLYRTLDFLRKITHVVILCAVIMWFLSSFPAGRPFENSYAAMIGKTLAPFGYLVGLNWKMIVALLFGFFAKESTLSTLGVLYHASEGLGNLGSILAHNISPLVGLTFLVIYMFYIPCAATVSTIRKESNSIWFAVLSIVVSLSVALCLGMLVYNAGRLILLLAD